MVDTLAVSSDDSKAACLAETKDNLEAQKVGRMVAQKGFCWARY